MPCDLAHAALRGFGVRHDRFEALFVARAALAMHALQAMFGGDFDERLGEPDARCRGVALKMAEAREVGVFVWPAWV